MSPKDYELIAAAILDAQPVASLAPADLPILRQAWVKTAETIAESLASENPRFNRDTFLRACGVQS